MNRNRVAQLLLEIGAVKLNLENPFTWTSGIESPIYCDNRMTLSDIATRNLIRDSLIEMVKIHFPETTMIAGIATGAIGHAAIVADHLRLPFCYVRPEPKKHGMKNQVEGFIPKGSKVLMVEDLISTGKSSIQATQTVKDCLKQRGDIDSEMIGLIGIFEYGFTSANNKFVDEKLEYMTITNFSTLATLANETGKISDTQLTEVYQFVSNPMTWRNNAQLLAQKNQQIETPNPDEVAALGHS